jgi:hypothetical protein
MKPLKLKSSGSLRLRVGYVVLVVLFLTAFLSGVARSHFLTP